MNSAGDKFLKLLIQALRDGWMSLGAAAWVVAGLLLLFGIVAGFVLWRWIWRGGLLRRVALTRTMQSGPGSAPAPGASNRRLRRLSRACGTTRNDAAFAGATVFREGAENCGRGCPRSPNQLHHSKLRSTSKVGLSLLIAVLAGYSGCQTFSLTQEQWELQQRGGMVDPAVGSAVGAVGSVGTLAGAITGAVLKK